MTQVGQVSVGLGLDDAKFKKGIKDAEKQTLQFAGVMKKALAGVAAGFTVGAVVKAIKSSVEAYRTQEIAVKSLNQALMNSGVYTEEYSRAIQQLASEIQSYSNYGDEAIEKAVGLGQAFAGNVKMTNELIKATVDFAAATGMDLDGAFKLVGKSIGSSTNALGRYGIVLDQNMTASQKAAALQQQLGQKFKGSAKEMSNASVQLSNAIGDLAEQIGGIFNPAVEASQHWLIKATKSMTEFLQTFRVMNAEIKNLNKSDDLQLRLQKNNATLSLYEKNWSKFDATAKAQGKKSIERLKAENEEILKQLEIVKKTEKEKEKQSKANYTPFTESKTGKNEALDEYKKFVDEFKAASNEYYATLKARRTVEKTLGTTAFALDADYNGLVEAYKNYEQKKLEIMQSKAANKLDLQLKNEIELQQALQKVNEDFARETAQKTWQITKSMQDEMAKISLNEQAYQNSGGFLASFGTNFEKRLQIEQEYLEKRKQIQDQFYNTAKEKEADYNNALLLYNKQMLQLETDSWRERGHQIYDIFNNTFSNMLTNYGDFSDNMKQLALNLTNFIIKELLQIMITSQAVKGALSSIGGGIFSFLGFHSGGTILPTGSKHHYGGQQLPQADQTEHFALLKNNERVLSPSETAAYNQGDGNGQANYIVYAPQVKAMDSREVASWFNENKQQIIGIVSQGIKNNNQGLRTQIQGV